MKNEKNLLKSLLIKNFKSVGELSKVDFENLTLLCGENSSGKSTIINSLLLLSQNYHQYYQPTTSSFPINGVVQQLGSISSIKNKNNNSEISIGFVGSKNDKNYFFQISLDNESNNLGNIVYSKYISDWLEDFEHEDNQEMFFATGAFEFSLFEDNKESSYLLEQDLPNEVKSIFKDYLNLMNQSNSNLISSFSFNAKEYQFGVEKSLISDELIKSTFSNKLQDMDLENGISFNGVVFKDGFPAYQLSKPKDLKINILNALRQSFLEFDWESIGVDIMELFLHEILESNNNFFENTDRNNKLIDLDIKNLEQLLNNFFLKKEPLSPYFKSLFEFGMPIQMINELNRFENQHFQIPGNLTELLGIISYSLFGFDISTTKVQLRKSSKRNLPIDELLEILFLYNILNLDELKEYGPIQESMYEFIVSTLVTNSENEVQNSYTRAKKEIQNLKEQIYDLNNSDLSVEFESEVKYLFINHIKDTGLDEYVLGDNENIEEMDPRDVAPELYETILSEAIAEEVAYLGNKIFEIQEKFFLEIPLDFYELKEKIKRFNNEKVFFYNNSDFVNKTEKQLDHLLEVVNKFMNRDYFIKTTSNLESKKFYIDSIFSVVNIESNLLLFEEKDILNLMYEDIQEILKHVKYLGPLRDRSTSSVRDDLFPAIIPLGKDGEYFIKHYQFNKNKKISTVIPFYEFQIQNETSSLNQPNNKDAVQNIEDSFDSHVVFNEVDTFTVEEAFNKWIHYFGLGDYFQVVENAQKPNQLDSLIKPIDLDTLVSPSSVGVGFSQIAPIILMCLTAEKSDILIFEQPELHLHPGLQQKLADFFLHMSKTGIQIIIETHSDHILNRIRLRTLEDLDSFDGKVNIVFVEKENKQSIFNQFKISEDGDFGFDKYPKGFFDQTSKDTFKLLKVKALQKAKIQNELNNNIEDEPPH